MLCMLILMLVILCHFHCEASSAVVRPHSITTGSRHPVSVIHEANTTVVRPHSITTGVVTAVVRPYSITTKSHHPVSLLLMRPTLQ